jgi:hypothetical protein
MDIYLTASSKGRMVKLAEPAPFPPKARVEVHEWRGSNGGYPKYLDHFRLGAWASGIATLSSFRGHKVPRFQRSDFATVGEAVAAIEAHLQLTGGF